MASPQPAPPTTQIRDTGPLPPPLPALPRRIQELRDGSQITTRSTAPKGSRRRQPRSRHRTRHRQLILGLDDDESFNNHLGILKILQGMPALGNRVPQLTSDNPAARTYTLKYPRYALIPLDMAVRYHCLSHGQIQDFKSELRKAALFMYDNGVEYHIYLHHLYLFRLRSRNSPPLLFLGSVTNSRLLDKEQLNRKEQRDHVRAQIDRAFAPLDIWAIRKENTSLADDAREKMKQAKIIIEDEVLGAINKSFKTPDTCKSRASGAHTFIADARRALHQAYSKIEDAEKSLGKMDAPNRIAEALRQKYGDQEPDDAVDTENAILPRIQTRRQCTRRCSHRWSQVWKDSRVQAVN